MTARGDGRRICVLWVAKGLGPGGMERLLVNHARFGDRERFEYHAAYVVERPESVVGELEDLGVPCHRLGTGGTDPRWPFALRSLARRIDADVVHSHSPLPAAAARLVSRSGRSRPALVYTEHNTWDCYGRATRLANSLTYRLDDARFAVSTEAAACAPTGLRRPPEVLTHGIDVEGVRAAGADRRAVRAEIGASESTTVVTTVANLRTEKAYDVLLPAARQVLDRHPDVVFLAVGHGPRRAELEDLHRRLGLGDRFRFLGFRKDAVRLMGASDVFALSSRQEGLPVAFMEATALGLPVVSTAVGGLPDFVDDGTTGLLVRPEDAGQLATALGRLVEDPELRARLAEGSAKLADTFDARTAVRRQEQVYEELAR